MVMMCMVMMVLMIVMVTEMAMSMMAVMTMGMIMPSETAENALARRQPVSRDRPQSHKSPGGPLISPLLGPEADEGPAEVSVKVGAPDLT
eukprot:6063101-Pyramimonas_sp.AAC.1